MRAWIFQANPDDFDLTGYLAASSELIVWQVNQYANDMGDNDQVFLWQAIGSGDREESGVVAEARMRGGVRVMREDDSSRPFWKVPYEGEAMPRAVLSLVRIANKKQILKREWLEADPILSQSRIIRLRAGTNFPLTHAEADRLRALWSRTGVDFDRRDLVAALWAYDKTYGGEISRLPGTPVDIVAQKIGRASSGIYNKLMNFRSIDPRDSRKGLSGGSRADASIWAEFFDPVSNGLRSDQLEAEFQRLWGDSDQPTGDAGSLNASLDAEVRRLSSRPMAALLAAYNASIEAKTSKKPKAIKTNATAYERNPLVVVIAKARARNLSPPLKYRRFIVCYDCDNTEPKQRYQEIVEKIILPCRTRGLYCVLVPVQEMEAWILADIQAVQNVIKGWVPNAINNPESIPEPKELIEKLSRDSNRRPRYSHAVHNERGAEYLDLNTVAKKCNSFLPLVDFVRNDRSNVTLPSLL